MYDGCKLATWWGGFDKKGWIQCDSSTHYITGIWRNTNTGFSDTIRLLEKAKCCPALPPNQDTSSSCKNTNWWAALDYYPRYHVSAADIQILCNPVLFLIFVLVSTNTWAVCPNGYFVQGFYQTDGDWLHNIEEAKCCKPNALPDRYEHCYNENVGSSFDKSGLSKCKKDGYYLAVTDSTVLNGSNAAR
ncbi:uncharacterized protein LOC110058880 [Orbicella faveolata]|uniref:uncharacterized protein LOC110058880 n=1 Tax=Orbicella faveolata TaxID=48498 RepID=UPI0009E47AAE|nr:uncharacterized protein LOC110058880 [Orbicella faveolata]